jgi:hypothetical protein
VGLELGIDVTEVDHGFDGIGPAHGLVGMTAWLEAVHDPNTTTTREADHGDESEVDREPAWILELELIEEREADPGPERRGEIEAGTDETGHARECVPRGGIEAAHALNGNVAVLAMCALVEQTTMIREKGSASEVGTGIGIVRETATVTSVRLQDAEAGKGLAGRTGTKTNPAKGNARRSPRSRKKSLSKDLPKSLLKRLLRSLLRSLLKSPKSSLKDNLKRHQKNGKIVEAVLGLEPRPLPPDLAQARLRTALRSGRWKRSGNEKRRPRPTWRLRRTPGTRACRSLDSMTRRAVARGLPTCVDAGIWTTLTDTHLEAVKSGEGVEVEVAADSGIETRTEIETGTGRRPESGNAREIETRTTGTETETGEIRIASETWTEIAIGIGTDGIGIERGTVTVIVHGIAIETAIEIGSGVIGIGIGIGIVTETEIANEIGRGTGVTGGTGVCHLGEIDGIVAGAVVEL